MNLEQLTELLKWMTIINIGLLVFSVLLIMLLKNFVAKMHSKLFGIKQDQVAIVAYSYLGIFKVLIIVFNIVPYISLLLIHRV